MTTAEQCKLRGNEHFQLGQFELAAGSYSEAIRQEPHVAVYWVNRSQAYRQLRMWDDALQDANQALELDPSNGKARYSQVLCLQALRRFQDALHFCRAGLAAQPDGKALQQLAVTLEEQLRKQLEKKAFLAQERQSRQPPPRAASPAASDSSSSSSSSSGQHAWKPKPAKPREITEAEMPSKRLCDSASKGDFAECRRLLDAEGADAKWKNPMDRCNTALHSAADNGHEQVARVLLTTGADPMAMNDAGLTAFCLAEPSSIVYKLLEGITQHLNEGKRLCEAKRYC